MRASTRRLKTGSLRLWYGNPDRKVPGPPGWGLSVGLTTQPRKQPIVTKTNREKSLKGGFGPPRAVTPMEEEEVLLFWRLTRLYIHNTDVPDNWHYPTTQSPYYSVHRRVYSIRQVLHQSHLSLPIVIHNQLIFPKSFNIKVDTNATHYQTNAKDAYSAQLCGFVRKLHATGSITNQPLVMDTAE
jgi:hypothetical protein